ncbi:MAG: dihydrofolate reductase family protein [Gemmatimonas sp.]
MKTQYYTACTLDGFLADEHNNLDWLFQFGDGPEGDYPEFIRNVGALAMGSTTYEWLLDHMIREGADKKQPWPYAQPTWVFTSRTLETVPGADIRFVSGDVRTVHDAMVRAADGQNVWIVGGGELVGQFYDCGLMDELIISMASVTLGKGAPLFPRRIVTPPLKLVSVEKWGTGFAHLTYEVPKP